MRAGTIAATIVTAVLLTSACSSADDTATAEEDVECSAFHDLCSCRLALLGGLFLGVKTDG